MRVWALRLRRTEQGLALVPLGMLPSHNLNLRRPGLYFSQLNTRPTYTPVYASRPASRRTRAKLGAVWIASRST